MPTTSVLGKKGQIKSSLVPRPHNFSQQFFYNHSNSMANVTNLVNSTNTTNGGVASAVVEEQQSGGRRYRRSASANNATRSISPSSQSADGVIQQEIKPGRMYHSHHSTQEQLQLPCRPQFSARGHMSQQQKAANIVANNMTASCSPLPRRPRSAQPQTNGGPILSSFEVNHMKDIPKEEITKEEETTSSKAVMVHHQPSGQVEEGNGDLSQQVEEVQEKKSEVILAIEEILRKAEDRNMKWKEMHQKFIGVCQAIEHWVTEATGNTNEKEEKKNDPIVLSPSPDRREDMKPNIHEEEGLRDSLGGGTIGELILRSQSNGQPEEHEGGSSFSETDEKRVRRNSGTTSSLKENTTSVAERSPSPSSNGQQATVTKSPRPSNEEEPVISNTTTQVDVFSFSNFGFSSPPMNEERDTTQPQNNSGHSGVVEVEVQKSQNYSEKHPYGAEGNVSLASRFNQFDDSEEAREASVSPPPPKLSCAFVSRFADL